MSLYTFCSFSYLLVLMISWTLTLYGYRSLPTALRVVSILVGITFFTECTGYILALVRRNNLAVYNIFSLVQTILTIFYFKTTLPVLQKGRRAVILMGIAILFNVFNTSIFQPLYDLNSNFMFFQGLLTISLGLYGLNYHIMRQPTGKRGHGPYFWINLILVFFWSATFLDWSIYDYLAATAPGDMWIINMTILIANIITYLGIGSVYYFYRPHGRANA